MNTPAKQLERHFFGDLTYLFITKSLNILSTGTLNIFSTRTRYVHSAF